ncbi:hypothetical protein [Spongiactinospora sp. TRM90649]|uniref:hypothetical protein n=1 Tax=Spongiactinospora sp. TRM90649 TaxID=3031114 RepID=UPI0023F9FD03|nr:hypothetical protein [Spongiactinospora sp. TRM90649]MDF5757558.1 hypothetical protein [Spongiactinospora sp. TRM90649]
MPTGVSHGGPAVFRKIAERGDDIAHWGGRQSASHMVAMADPEGLTAHIRAFFGGL